MADTKPQQVYFLRAERYQEPGFWLRVLIGGAGLLVYSLVFYPLYNLMGSGVTTIATVPVILIAWLLGTPGGGLAAILATLLNVLLLNTVGEPGWMIVVETSGGLFGHLLLLGVGLITGAVSDLLWRLRAQAAQLQEESAERKKVEERYRTLFDATFEGIAVHEQGTLIDANHIFIDMFQLDNTAFHRVTIYELVVEEAHDEVRRRVTQGSTQAYEVVGIRQKDRTRFPLEIRGKNIKYLGQEVRVAAVRDLTHQKQTEVVLQRQLRDARLMSEAVAATTSTLNPDEILTTICAELAHALELPQAAVALLDADEEFLVVTAEYREDGRPSTLGSRIPADTPINEYILKEKEPLAIGNVRADPRFKSFHSAS